MLRKQGSYKRRNTRGADHLKNPTGERGEKMKILAVATVAVFLCCLEVALSYPKFVPKPRYPEAELQEKAPFEMDGYRNEYIAEVERGTFKYCSSLIFIFQTPQSCNAEAERSMFKYCNSSIPTFQTLQSCNAETEQSMFR